jgi:LPS O-antigen subunit length determinant protein (WzzB/FepE family)
MNWRQDLPDHSSTSSKSQSNAPGDRDLVLEAVNRFWLLIVVSAGVLAVAAFLLSSIQAKTFSSSAQIELINSPYAEVGFVRGGDETRTAKTETRVANGQVVRKLVRESLGRDPYVTVTLDPDSAILTFQALAGSPSQAQTDVTEYVKTYLSFSKSRAKRTFEKALDTIDGQISDTSRALREPDLDDQSKQLLATTLSRYRDERNNLSAALKLDPETGTVISDAQLPLAEVSPKPIQSGILGGLFGALLGVALATWLVLRSPRRIDLRHLEQFRSIPLISSQVPSRVFSARRSQAVADEVATDVDSAMARGSGVGVLFITLADSKSTKSLLEHAVEKLGKLRGPVARLDIEPSTNIEGVCGQTESQRRANRNVAIVLPIEGARTAAALSSVSSSVFVLFSGRNTSERVLERRLLQLQANGFTIDGLVAV